MANNKQTNTLRFLKSEKVKKELTKAQIKSIQKMYKELAKDVEKEITKLSNKTVTDKLKKVYLDSYLKELSKETSRINKVIEADARKGILTISQAVVDEEIMRINLAGGLGVAGLSSKFCHIPTDIVATITSGQLYESKWSLSGAIWSADKKQHQIIYNTVAKGIAKNASLEEIAKALGDYISPDRRRTWDMARFYPGSRRKIDYNAMRLVKTMNNHAYMESFQRATEHDPFIEAYQWNNGHAPNVCPICEQIASDDMYGLGPGVFPKGDVPLDHPNGQCFITGVQTKSPEEVANAIADWYNGVGDEDLNSELDEFAKDFGYTPARAKKVAKAAGTKRDEIKSLKNVDKAVDEQYKRELSRLSAKGGSAEPFGEYDKILKTLVDNNEFRMRIPADDTSVISQIIKDGRLKSQFETATSKGALDTKLREEASRALFGIKDKMAKADFEKYGYLGSQNILKDTASSVKAYGDGIITLKKEAMLKRTTMTIGDSLGSYRMEQFRIKQFGKAGGVRACKVTDIKSLVCGGGGSNVNDQLAVLKEYIAKKGVKDASGFSRCFGGTKRGYLELQYHGAVTLKDIESFTLKKDVIKELLRDKKVVKILKDNKITLQYIEKKKVIKYAF